MSDGDELIQGVALEERSLCTNDLLLFAGMALLLIATSIVSYWVQDFRAVAALQVGNLIGAGTMYLRGK